MSRIRLPVPLVLLLIACGGEPTSPPVGTGLTSCATAPVTVLAAGESAVLDATTNSGCLRLPAVPAGAEHIVVALSGAGDQTTNGISGSYRLRAGSGAGTPITRLGFAPRVPNVSARFHAMLRQRERVLAPAASAARFLSGPAPLVAPPAVGDVRSFSVCSTDQCTGFVTVGAKARYVGSKGAIYVDTLAPAGGYTQADIDSVGQLFDGFLYPIDTTAFGRESDLDGNGVVVVLLTPAVNRLTPNCNGSSVILGYFFGADLTPTVAGSNDGEIFYSIVPDPSNTSCTIPTSFAKQVLAPTFIHEFQHMISFNQHVLLRGGDAEDTWLNEGLSHFAEELGGRQVPNQFCGAIGGTPDCFSEFLSGDVTNAYAYLSDVESNFLVEPGNSSGTLPERGANWLFVRWLADQFGGGDSLGGPLTRALDATRALGAANVAAVTGQPFATLASEWQLANYLDGLPGFTPKNPHLQYRSWNFRSTFGSLHTQDPTDFPQAYPLTPDTTLGSYLRVGTLRGGSGRHLRVIQTPNAPATDLQLTDSAGAALTPTAAPRWAVARIR